MHHASRTASSAAKPHEISASCSPPLGLPRETRCPFRRSVPGPETLHGAGLRGVPVVGRRVRVLGRRRGIMQPLAHY